MNYKLGSLFDGSGGFPFAGSLCGIEPRWAAEVEPYPIAVTRTRFPKMKHLGDISKVSGAEIEPVDIITFGSPCQDLSVAGKRAGLKHEANGDEETTRSGLFMEAVRIIKEMRKATNGKYPSFALWENVPGAFSSNNGEDFRIVLEELIKIVEPQASMPPIPSSGWAYADSYVGDGWSLAYRVFDAQYWGVPQRRRRIHLVLDLRGERAGEVLFEREGVRGYFETSGAPWQATPEDAQGSPGADDCTGEADGGRGSGGRQLDAVTYAVDQGGGKSGANVYNDKAPTLCTTHGGEPAVAYSFDSLASNSMKSSNPHSGCRAVDVAKTLDTTDPSPNKNQGGIAVVEQVPYTLKVRSGCAVDSAGKSAGKGALIQTDKAATLSTVQDQYLFQPVTDTHILDDQGGSVINVRTDGKSPTLRAQMGGHPPVVMQPCGVDLYNGIETGDKAATLTTQGGGTASGPSVVYAVDSHPMDSRVGLDESGKVQTLTSRMGTGGGNVPMVMEPFCKSGRARSADDATTWKHGKVANTLNTFDQGETRTNELVVEDRPVICLQGNGIDRADTAGCNGKEWNDETCYTLNTIDRPAVAYGIDRAAYNQGQNAKYDFSVLEEQQPTMVARDPGAVTYSSSKASFFTRGEEELASTLVATDYKDSPLINDTQNGHYIVRRLTPTECARLQGFPDRWGDINPFNPDEWEFWAEVRNTHAAINGKKVQEYTAKQMETWYNKLHTDSAEYKMWGNGIAIPPALYVIQGMMDAFKRYEETTAEDDSWML